MNSVEPAHLLNASIAYLPESLSSLSTNYYSTLPVSRNQMQHFAFPQFPALRQKHSVVFPLLPSQLTALRHKNDLVFQYFSNAAVSAEFAHPHIPLAPD